MTITAWDESGSESVMTATMALTSRIRAPVKLSRPVAAADPKAGEGNFEKRGAICVPGG